MAGQLTIDTLKASSGVLATQNGMTGIAKSWANFDGASGTVNTSFNVSSVTRNGVGDYTVNFTTAMATARYSAIGVASLLGAGSQNVTYDVNQLTTATRFYCYDINNQVRVDSGTISVSILST